MFAARLHAAGGSVSFAQPRLLAQAVAAAVDEGLPVVVTPDLSWLVGRLREHGIAAFVGTRAAVAAAGSGGDQVEAPGGDQVEAPGGDVGSGVEHRLEESLRRCGTGVTDCLAAIASSGTIVVGPGGGNGGLISALPARHVAILQEGDIREHLAETLALVQERLAQSAVECVFVTGPSRTADIEMMSVVGVHGPVALEVIVIRGEET
ncbi:MAG: LUD domain-containing protein [Thermoleophilia bacterium]